MDVPPLAVASDTDNAIRSRVSAIPEAELAGIRVPTALIWGRHDLQTRLRVAQAASARYGWPLHVIEDCGVDPHVEQPDAFLNALRATLDGRQPVQRATDRHWSDHEEAAMSRPHEVREHSRRRQHDGTIADPRRRPQTTAIQRRAG